MLLLVKEKSILGILKKRASLLTQCFQFAEPPEYWTMLGTVGEMDSLTLDVVAPSFHSALNK